MQVHSANAQGEHEDQSVSRRACNLLGPFAQQEEITSILDPVFYKLGTHEGVAVLLVASQFKPSAAATKNGEAANYDHATLEAYRMIDNLWASSQRL